MFLTPYVSAPRPFAFWSDLDSEFDRIFENTSNATPSSALMRWDVREEKDQWLFTVLAPGLTASDIKIDATSETIAISGSHARTVPEGYKPVRQERLDLTFNRTFQFPTPIDPEQVTASLVDGVLTVRAHKRAAAQPTSIKILTNHA